MDDLLYNTYLKYFTKLSNVGYGSDVDLKKIIFYTFIYELVNTTSIVISEKDYKEIETALYCIYGTSCLIPYPNYCKNSMYLHLGDITELASRVVKAEKEIEYMKEHTDAGVSSRVEVLEQDVATLKGHDYVLETDPS